jgi:hypothetical protein
MRLSRITFATLFTLADTVSFAQTRTANSNTKISLTFFQMVAQSWAANVPVSTLAAIARTESALYPIHSSPPDRPPPGMESPHDHP